MLVSVIVLSSGRGDFLRRALQSLRFQSYTPFEVIVVGDSEADAAIKALDLQNKTIFVPFDFPNVAAARNAGLAVAQGEVTAFMDDDSVAEPHWLSGLMQGFEAPGVQIVGGFVRARNGISYQWRGETVSCIGAHVPLDLPDDQISYITATSETTPEVIGTNCAYQTQVLKDIGGFDPGFAYFLDESDVNYRLGHTGAVTAIVPWAQVHHGLAPTGQRDRDNVPKSLARMAHSLMLFLKKHADSKRHDFALQQFRLDQRIKLLRHMQAGRLTPGDVLKLLASFDQATGAAPVAIPSEVRPTAQRDVIRLYKDHSTLDAVSFVVWPWQRDIAVDRAIKAAKRGCVVTVFELSPSTLFHRVWFDPRGFWVHRGGIWGRSDRSSALVQFMRRERRVALETNMRTLSRNFGDLIFL